MKILSVETSCDETGIAIVQANGDLKNPKFEILENLVATQIETHRPWGGVVPGLAKRDHEKNLPELFEKIKDKTEDVDIIAVTVGPGLDPCLWTGVNFVKEIHKKYFPTKTKLIGVNHMEGHLFSFLLSQKIVNSEWQMTDGNIFPAVQLVVSGGHTMLVHMKSISEWEVIGETQDDAVGEAFDKVARMMGLPYPGGPEISKAAEKGNPETVGFPRPMLNSNNYNFSFSGLKTAVLYHLKGISNKKKDDKLSFDLSDNQIQNISASFQEAVVDTLSKKTLKAVKGVKAKSIILSGGVAANSSLRRRLKEESENIGINFLSADAKYQTDNGVVIAVAAYMRHASNKKEYKIEAQPNLKI